MNTVTRKNQKYFFTGLLFVCVGSAALWIARDYDCGTPSKMGPGYFPTGLAVLLMLIGIISLVKGVFQAGPKVAVPALKPLAYVCGSSILFGLLLKSAGLIAALTVLILVSASASDRFRFEWRAFLGMIGLILFCVIVFAKLLAMPMPLFGSWFFI